MHGGFGGGGGHSGGGHGGGHGGGGHGDGGGHMHHGGGEGPNMPNAIHNLGGESQSILGHMTSLVSNGQGLLGHIAGWLVGQHTGVMHHNAGTQNHVGDASWASAALQVDKSETWVQKVTKIPGIHFFFLFLVVVGWLMFLGVLRHGDAQHPTRSPMPTQQEWRQQLLGSTSTSTSTSTSPNSNAGQDSAAGDADQAMPQQVAQQETGFVDGGTSPFGSPRGGGEGPQAYTQAPIQMQSIQTQPVQPVLSAQPMQMQQMQAPSQAAPSAFGGASANGASPPGANPAASIGRRSFSARSAMSAEPAADAPAELPPNGRNFHHRVVAER